MFTKDELREMKKGINLRIQYYQSIYDDKIKSADRLGWDIGQGDKNSIDYVSSKISRLYQLRKKIIDEINM